MSQASPQWEQFVDELRAKPPGVSHELHIRDSWARCREAGVNRAYDRSIRLHRIADNELEMRMEENRALIEAATDPLDRFSAAMCAVGHVIYVTDCDGIVLLSRGNDDIMMMYGLLPGYDWSEKRMGTNGAGTALASGKAVAVVGTDHYQLPFHESTCLAAPIRSASGEIVGAVDFSTHVNDARPSQLAQIAALAASIEEALVKKLERKMRRIS